MMTKVTSFYCIECGRKLGYRAEDTWQDMEDYCSRCARALFKFPDKEKVKK